jgi:murein DD-endopeptidase MepM/ murein hydrolase activator NlpD
MRVGLYLIIGFVAVVEWCSVASFLAAKDDDVTATPAGVSQDPRVATTASSSSKTQTEVRAFVGTVYSDIWSSAAAAGLSAGEVAQMAEIFAWQLDFSRDLQPGDRWRLTFENAPRASQHRGAILAAEVERGERVFQAIRYVSGKQSGYYTADGGSLQRQFLRSPLYKTHVTSAFAKHRFHPILKVSLPHLGVDYGAPYGTPVMAAGDGVVLAASYHGGSGKSVVLSHGNRYETRYKHLSRYAAGLKVGQRVNMGQVIGYVGATGLATGPHLHFEFYDGRRVINPEAAQFPAVDVVPPQERGVFMQLVAQARVSLPPWPRRMAMVSAAPSL